MRPSTLALGVALALAPLAAASAQTAAPPAAAPATAAEEARCLMTMAAFTGAKDPNTASSAQFGVAYYAGRIKARDPSYDLGARLKSVADGMNGQNMQAEANRCGALVIQALKELETAQAAMKPPAAAAKPAPAKPAPAPKKP